MSNSPYNLTPERFAQVAQPRTLAQAANFKQVYSDRYKLLPSVPRRRVIELNPMDKMRLEAARGLLEKGRLPSVQEYNNAVFINKLAGIQITHDQNGSRIE